MTKLRLIENIFFIGGIVSYFLPWFFYGFGRREPEGLSINVAAACWITAYCFAMGERYRQAEDKVREMEESLLNPRTN